MSFFKLEPPPTRNSMIGDKEYLTISGLWDRWFSKASAFWNSMAPSVSADNGDSDVTLYPGRSESTQIFNTPITRPLNVGLSTEKVWVGAKFRIVRRAGATGAFSIDVGGVKSLTAAGQWCDVEFDGTSWILTAPF